MITATALTALAVALVVALAAPSSSPEARMTPKVAAGEPDGGKAAMRRGRHGGKLDDLGWDDYRASALAYPAPELSPLWSQNAEKTFNRIAAQGPAPKPVGRAGVKGAKATSAVTWQLYGPQQRAEEPGVLAFAGAGENEASRTPALAMWPVCNASRCRMWAGPAGGGVWRTDQALEAEPVWKDVSGSSFAQNSIGELVLDPNDTNTHDGETLYAGTGEPNMCSSGCQAGVGIYKSVDGGNNWQKLASSCVSNATWSCVTPGQDAFLGRGIGEIVVEPGNPNHLLVGSTTAARSISHIIGLGGQARGGDPGANTPGLYESFDGGATFTPVWIPDPDETTPYRARRGVTDVGLDPVDKRTVYASAMHVGLWRRCPQVAAGQGGTSCGGEVAGDDATAQYDFEQVFASRMPYGSSELDRTQFDLTVAPNNGNKTRIYLVTGRNQVAPADGESPASLWRTDNANQTSAALLATEPPPPAAGPPGNGNPYPALYNGWQILTTPNTASPYWATHNFCTGQCWYDMDVYTPKNPLNPLDPIGRHPDQVYVLGSYLYGELPCYTKGVGCGSGISNGRGVLWSTTAGDPDASASLGLAQHRTFTDMTMDGQNVGGSHCAYKLAETPCIVAHHAIHPDQHEILVNPNNQFQFFEASDGGIARTNGAFIDFKRACEFRGVPSQGIPPLEGNRLAQCRRLLSRIPRELGTINQTYARTLQFIGMAVNPSKPCHIMGGTQDNSMWHTPNCDQDIWPKTIYGDGATPGFDAYPDQSPSYKGEPWAFGGFTSGITPANFRNGDPEKWVDIFWPMLNAGEFAAFYWPQIADPNPPMFNGSRTHPIFTGFQHVWRSWAFGAGRPQNSVPQQTNPDIDWYEANCPDFYLTPPECGDFQAMGGPGGFDTPGDLTGTAYGNDRLGVAISAIARRGADQNTLWATTSAGRVFVTRNAHAVNPAGVVWHRVDNLPQAGGPPGSCPPQGSPAAPPPAGAVNCSPGRHPNGIYADPNNPNVAYVVYSGYNAVTPGTPGHVFRITLANGPNGAPTNATFTNLNIEAGGTNTNPTPRGQGDLPVNDIVMNDRSGVLYAATDWGVLQGNPAGGGAYSWGTTIGMPKLAVAHLSLAPSQRDACRVCGRQSVLYAATHGQGIWRVLNPE
ncbi:MAG: WD40/YVTN/BNR-like repeat-containing protein [Gaiellaceae bacterium]